MEKNQEKIRKTRRWRKGANNSSKSVEADAFTYLPLELISNILSRLPLRTVMSCRFVCKPWKDLIETEAFARSYRPEPVETLAVFQRKSQPSKPLTIVEFVDDEPDLDSRQNVVFNLDLPPLATVLHSSAKGLLFLSGGRGDELILCNPITRDYITLPKLVPHRVFGMDTYGFGVSRVSGQYKVVRVLQEVRVFLALDHRERQFVEFECQVYTLGTGSWRRIDPGSPLEYMTHMVGVFLNGNLHWVARKDSFWGPSTRISSFDLEIEAFRTFSPPPTRGYYGKFMSLSVLGDCLCACDNVDNLWTFEYEIDIWLMKEYGDEKSWTKEFKIKKGGVNEYRGLLCPVRVLKDGDVLIENMDCNRLIYYSGKTKTIQKARVFRLEINSFTTTSAFAPTLLSLKMLATENVSSF